METMSFTGLTADAEMLGYCDGFALAKTEWGAILVSERPEEFFFPGEAVESEFFTPSSALPEEKQAQIRAYLKQQKGGKKKDLQAMRQEIQGMAEEYEKHPENLVELAQFSARFYAYSVRNQMLLKKKNPNAVFVGSFEKFRQLGYAVRRGEHGIKLFVPTPVTLFQSEPDGDWKTLYEANETEKEQLRSNLLETKKVLRFKAGTVFDLSQTNCPKEDDPKLFPREFSSDQHREIQQGLRRFFEENLQQKTVLNDRLEDRQKVAVLAHEMGQALLHREVDYSTASPSKIELQADLLSLLFQSHFGVEIPNSYKAHFAEHCRNYRQYCKVNRDTENADSLLECFETCANIYRENIDEIDRSIEHKTEKTQTIKPTLSEEIPADISFDFAPQNLQDLYQEYQEKLRQSLAGWFEE